MSPSPSLSQLNFLSTAAQLSHHHPASLVPFFCLYSKLERERKKNKKLSTSKKHSDEWLFKSVIAGKIGLLCLWNGSGRECVDFFGHMHMRGAWCKGTLQTYIWTEGLNRFFFQKAVREAAHHKAWDWIHINKTVVQTFDWVNIWIQMQYSLHLFDIFFIWFNCLFLSFLSFLFKTFIS